MSIGIWAMAGPVTCLEHDKRCTGSYPSSQARTEIITAPSLRALTRDLRKIRHSERSEESVIVDII